VIVSRLRYIWAKTELEMPPDERKTSVNKEESHGA
jgi:hypothetical protein